MEHRAFEPLPLFVRKGARYGDPMLRKIAIVLGVLIALRLVAALVWPTINDVTTGATPQYPDLQPQVFGRAYEQVFDAAAAVARELGWEVTEEDRAKGVIQAVATTRLFRFKDDVTVTFGREGDQTKVAVRSHSRIGKGDLGANARRIRAFQAALAKRLGARG
jgi:uncharacterized protein (DUF1499 family)